MGPAGSGVQGGRFGRFRHLGGRGREERAGQRRRWGRRRGRERQGGRAVKEVREMCVWGGGKRVRGGAYPPTTPHHTRTQVHMLDIECFSFLNRALENDMAPVLVRRRRACMRARPVRQGAGRMDEGAVLAEVAASWRRRWEGRARPDRHGAGRTGRGPSPRKGWQRPGGCNWRAMEVGAGY
jgi:hypothetical protein